MSICCPCTVSIIVKTIETDRFDYVNLHWYYINQVNWPAIEAAQRQDMGVFIISPSDKGGKLYEPPPKLVELCKPLSPMQFNDLFCSFPGRAWERKSRGSGSPPGYEGLPARI